MEIIKLYWWLVDIKQAFVDDWLAMNIFLILILEF